MLILSIVNGLLLLGRKTEDIFTEEQYESLLEELDNNKDIMNLSAKAGIVIAILGNVLAVAALLFIATKLVGFKAGLTVFLLTDLIVFIIGLFKAIKEDNEF